MPKAKHHHIEPITGALKNWVDAVNQKWRDHNYGDEDMIARFMDIFAERYTWVRFYTPVNEMYVAAEFSAFYGWWNEQLTSHQAFVTALKHMVRANVEAMLGILAVRPDALFIQSESSEYTHARRPINMNRMPSTGCGRHGPLSNACARMACRCVA